VLKASLAVIFSAGLILTAGVGGALAHQVDGQASAWALPQDESGCGTHLDAGNENDDAMCDENADDSMDESIDSTDDIMTADDTSHEDGGPGQTGDHESNDED
jgi:hypothetical protein